LDLLTKYVQGAIRTFIDNIAILAVEGCLLDGLTEIFDGSRVAQMDEATIKKLAEEDKPTQKVRKRLDKKIDDLEEAQRICRRAGMLSSTRILTRWPMLIEL
jgi:hypothetical protein